MPEDIPGRKSGASDQRPALRSCLEYVREGDTLVVTRLDRLARSTLHLCQIAAGLERKGVSLKVTDQDIDTGSAAGRLLFNMLGLSPSSRRSYGRSASWTASGRRKSGASASAGARA